jgi:CheY-like chemotaxis protein
MGGTAGATSTPGQGSTFWFTARLKKHAGLPMPPSDAHARAETLLLRHHVGRRVLLAEDDPTNRDVIEELLASVGLDCEVACDGQEAVDKALATDFDLILMDMQMPRLDGLAAARQICAHAKGSPPMIVALTANVFAEDKQRCLDAGMREFLPKPVDPAKLYATLLDALNRVPRKPT